VDGNEEQNRVGDRHLHWQLYREWRVRCGQKVLELMMFRSANCHLCHPVTGAHWLDVRPAVSSSCLTLIGMPRPDRTGHHLTLFFANFEVSCLASFISWNPYQSSSRLSYFSCPSCSLTSSSWMANQTTWKVSRKTVPLLQTERFFLTFHNAFIGFWRFISSSLWLSGYHNGQLLGIR
jgi:hypothetical protein